MSMNIVGVPYKAVHLIKLKKVTFMGSLRTYQTFKRIFLELLTVHSLILLDGFL